MTPGLGDTRGHSLYTCIQSTHQFSTLRISRYIFVTPFIALAGCFNLHCRTLRYTDPSSLILRLKTFVCWVSRTRIWKEMNEPPISLPVRSVSVPRQVDSWQACNHSSIRPRHTPWEHGRRVLLPTDDLIRVKRLRHPSVSHNSSEVVEALTRYTVVFGISDHL